MQQIDQFKATFFQECGELLAKLEEHLSGLAHATDTKEELNAAFRAIHSIKGGAAMFGFARLVTFAHVFESALDAMRSGRVQISDEILEKALYATDVLSDLAASARDGSTLPPGHEAAARKQLEQSFLEAVEAPAKTAAAKPTAAKPVAATPAAVQPGAVAPAGELKLYRITFEPSADLLRRGLEPLNAVRSLQSLGKLRTMANTTNLPSFESLDPAVLYLSWLFELETAEPVEIIRSVFQFVSGSGKLKIELAQIAVEPAKTSPEPVTAGPPLLRSEGQRLPADRRLTSIRVDLDRVERLVDLVGEITIAQAMVLQHLDQSMVDSNSFLFRALTQLLQHSRNLQDGVMAIRAQPIRSIFSRMPRVAREVAQETGRVVQLEMSGEETEIDKTIIEHLSDPLIHIVRNSIDHGIEPPDVRRAAGKSEMGTVKLTAAQRGGRIVVEVTDDGRGIDRQAVLQRAVENKIVAAGAELTDDEINNLIFSPGLSTALTVSDISGRGVGMDIVHQNIMKLGGRVAVRSQPGLGTTTSITLPLTLAVLDGMIVRSGEERYLIPLSNIVECLSIPASDLRPVAGSGDMICSRGRQIPAVHLAKQFANSSSPLKSPLQVIVAELEAGNLIGLVVDEICGHKQVVIKSIRQNYRDVQGIAGATILGDGNVALILDVTQLALLASAQDVRTFKTKTVTTRSESQAA